MGPPAETHNCLRGCGCVDYSPFVCKSHNGKDRECMSFLSNALAACQCQSEASISCKCSIIKCSITLPQGTPSTHTQDMNTSICQIADAVLSTTSGAHSMFTMWCRDREDAPMALPYCLTESSPPCDRFLWFGLSYWTNNPEGHKNCWC